MFRGRMGQPRTGVSYGDSIAARLQGADLSYPVSGIVLTVIAIAAVAAVTTVASTPSSSTAAAVSRAIGPLGGEVSLTAVSARLGTYSFGNDIIQAAIHFVGHCGGVIFE